MVFPPIYYSPTVLGVSGGEGDASLRTPPTHFAMSGSNYSSARADFFRLLRCTLSPPFFFFAGAGLCRAPSSRGAPARPRPPCAVSGPGKARRCLFLLVVSALSLGRSKDARWSTRFLFLFFFLPCPGAHCCAVTRCVVPPRATDTLVGFTPRGGKSLLYRAPHLSPSSQRLACAPPPRTPYEGPWRTPRRHSAASWT